MADIIARSKSAVSAQYVTNVATVVPTTALPGRKYLLLDNHSDQVIFLGPSTVTAATGYPLGCGSQLKLVVGDVNLIYGIVESGSDLAYSFELA